MPNTADIARAEFVGYVSPYLGETTGAALYLTFTDKGVLHHDGLTAWLEGAYLTAEAVLAALVEAHLVTPADVHGEHVAITSAERAEYLAELDAIREALTYPARDSLAYGR